MQSVNKRLVIAAKTDILQTFSVFMVDVVGGGGAVAALDWAETCPGPVLSCCPGPVLLSCRQPAAFTG